MTVPDKFATSDQAPFYIPDAPYWMLLVRKGRHQLRLLELTFFCKHSRRRSLEFTDIALGS